MKNIYFKSIIRNIFSQTAGQILSLLLNLLSIALAARYLGVKDFGLFNTLLAFIVIISKIVDLGISPNIFRQYSIERDIKLINTGVLLRSILLIAVSFVYNIISFWLDVSFHEITLANILLFNLLISSKGFIREIYDIPYKTDLTIHIPMIIMLIDNIIFLILIIILPLLNGGLTYLVVVYTFSNLPGFIIIIYSMKKRYGYKLNFNMISVRWLIQNSAPLYVYVILTALFVNVDLLLVKILDSDYAAGIYSAATRITVPLTVIPVAFIHSFFPQIINNYNNYPEKNHVIIKFLFKILYLFSFVIAVVTTFKSTEIVIFIFGKDFYQSAAILTILLWGQVLMFHSFFIINLLVAYDKQTPIYIYSIVIVFVNLLFNYYLIPSYSFLGAAYSKFISIFVGFIITLIILFKSEGTLFLNEKGLYIFSCIYIIIIYLISFMNLWTYLILSIGLLLVFLFFTKFFNSFEIKALLKLINKEKYYHHPIVSKYLE